MLGTPASIVYRSRLLCILLVTTPLTAGAKGLLHEDPVAHVLRTDDPVSSATSFSTTDYATGNWWGVRDEMKEKGIEFVPTYTTEPAANIDGGEKSGSTYIHNIDLDLKLDLNKLFGVPRTTFLMKASQRSGTSLSERKIAPSEGHFTLFTPSVFYSYFHDLHYHCYFWG